MAENAKQYDEYGEALNPKVINLPTDIKDWVKTIKAKPKLNDLVEEIHEILIRDSNKAYWNFLNAVYDSQAVEGKLEIDDLMAAQMIRERAKDIQSPVQNEKLATIMHSLRVVLSRYGFSRKDRRKA